MPTLAFELFELRRREFWVSAAGEFLATTLFVFLVCGSTLNWQSNDCKVIHISLTAGLSIATLAMLIGHLSGGLINPAVSVAFLVTQKISIMEGIVYVLVQLLGGILGAALLYGLTPSEVRGELGVTVPATSVSGGQAFGIELLLTFVLVLSIYAITDSKREHRGYEIPLAIGFAIAICHFVGISFTGCSINPARSFGPALIMNSWKYHWVYWVGPIPGGILAGLLYEHVFSSNRAVPIAPAN